MLLRCPAQKCEVHCTSSIQMHAEVFLSSILCALWSVVFILTTSLLDNQPRPAQPHDNHTFLRCMLPLTCLQGQRGKSSAPVRYAVLWGISESSVNCLCLCEFPLSRPGHACLYDVSWCKISMCKEWGGKASFAQICSAICKKLACVKPHVEGRVYGYGARPVVLRVVVLGTGVRLPQPVGASWGTLGFCHPSQ